MAFATSLSDSEAVCGLDYAFIRAGWLPSSLYTFLPHVTAKQVSLGVANIVADITGPPNLTTFRQGIPSLLLKSKSVASASFATPPLPGLTTSVSLATRVLACRGRFSRVTMAESA